MKNKAITETRYDDTVKLTFKDRKTFRKNKLNQIKLHLGRGVFISKEVKGKNVVVLVLGLCVPHMVHNTPMKKRIISFSKFTNIALAHAKIEKGKVVLFLPPIDLFNSIVNDALDIRKVGGQG
jgi:hypothetical protein